ncbi:hypothetical protein ACF0H5_013137 [Mactra antiquata]
MGNYDATSSTTQMKKDEVKASLPFNVEALDYSSPYFRKNLMSGLSKHDDDDVDDDDDDDIIIDSTNKSITNKSTQENR